MMGRDYLFRGKGKNGEWYFGDFITDSREYNRTCDKAYILPRWTKLNCPIEVIPETVGQFIGLLDKNQKKIFEGDIVRTRDFRAGAVFGRPQPTTDTVVEFNLSRGSYCFEGLGLFYKSELVEIIGNIHEGLGVDSSEQIHR